MSEDLSVMVKEPRDSAELGKWERTACVGPESIKRGETDFHAFSLSPVEEVYLQFIPPSVVAMLKDKSNWNNRLAAVGSMEKALKQSSSPLSDVDLKCVVSLISTSVSDSQSKVSQKGLQVMEYLVKLVGKRLNQYLAALTPKFLIKVGSNKGNLKKAGMSLFKTLMDTVGPMQMVNEIMSCGLRYKTTRVREEAINVIISALLYYENGGVDLLSVAKELALCMTDNKAKVRQASFEAMALITNRMAGNVELNQVIAMVVSVHKSTNKGESPENGLSLLDAYQSRLARKVVPKLDENGLVQHSVPALRSSSERLYSGPDIDWICAGAGFGVSPSASQQSTTSSTSSSSPPREVPPNSSQESTFRPYRSAGKRPWETTENKHEVSGCDAGF